MGCSPGMSKCGASCGHWQIVQGFREEYQRQNDALWERSGSFATEYEDNKRQLRENGTPQITFKAWLKGMKREPVDEPTTPPEPQPTPVRPGQDFFKFSNNRDANEAMLIATGLSSEAGVKAIRALDLKEFYVPLHQDAARAITWLDDRNLPHDGAAVTALLREHDRLPLDMDPQVPLFEVDPAEYGLGAWETYSPPAATAPVFAQAVRSEYRAREMEAICARGAAAARGAIEYGPDGLMDNDFVGQVRMKMANELREFPPALDGNLQPVQRGATMDAAVLPGQAQLNGPGLAPETLQPVEEIQVIQDSLRLPPMPVLSQAGREATSRG